MGLSDEKLMARYAAGDISAFQELFSRYEKRIYNFLLRRLRDKEMAADLFQEAFFRLHRNRRSFNPEYRFAAWFYQIVNNLVRDELRRKKDVLWDAGEDQDSLSPSDLPSPEEHVSATETGRKIVLALAGLPEAQREILLLSRFEGLSHTEIGEITGRSTAAVRQLLYRAVRNLRGQLHALT